MKRYKLKSLFYFFAYRLNRWLGGITKWERRDPLATSKMTWEACMALMKLRSLRRQLGHKLHPVLFKVIDDFARDIRKSKGGIFEGFPEVQCNGHIAKAREPTEEEKKAGIKKVVEKFEITSVDLVNGKERK